MQAASSNTGSLCVGGQPCGGLGEAQTGEHLLGLKLAEQMCGRMMWYEHVVFLFNRILPRQVKDGCVS